MVDVDFATGIGDLLLGKPSRALVGNQEHPVVRPWGAL
jgi:hypothetical protein